MQLQVNKGLRLATQGFIAVVCAVFSFRASAQEFGCGVVSAQSSSGAALLRSQPLDGTTPSIVGAKRIILIRVDFQDLPGMALTNSVATNMVVNLNNFYTESSYGLTTFALLGAGSDLTPVLRMPQRADYYGTNNLYDLLRSDARNAASTAGYVLTNYDFDLICFGLVPGWSWSGMGYVGTPGVWLRNSFNAGVASHELGHNFGLNHANFWETSGQSVTGPGYSVEQGDSFDTMGFALAGNNHFNAHYKNLLGWIPTNDVITVITSGVYRLNSHDSVNASGTRALVIPRGGGTNYWLEFRQKFTSNKWLMIGVGARLAQGGNQTSQLLDMSPGSPDAKNDSPIVLGRTFSDPQSGIYVTPISKGGTTPESINVVVNLGSFTGNAMPSVSLTASATGAAVGAALSFNANANDPDGDSLAYYWDFGDGTFGTNSPTALKSWSAAGEYLVRCLVSDMKGGLASASVIVQIGSASTFRISGHVSSGGSPVVNARVYASSSKMAYTDSDGSYNIVGISPGTYTLGASLYGYSFNPADFANPLNLGPNVTNVDFTATSAPAVPPTITLQPQPLTLMRGQPASFSIVATGSVPLVCQWRLNGSNIPGASASGLTITNLHVTDAGFYSVLITNAGGLTISSNALLTVLTPPPSSLTIGALTTNGSFLVRGLGAPGCLYRIEFSDGTVGPSWQVLGTVTSDGGGIFQLVDPSPSSRRFYRAVCP